MVYQIPISIILGKNKPNKDVNTWDYEDLEESIIIEDFIIIEKVEEYEDLIIITDRREYYFREYTKTFKY